MKFDFTGQVAIVTGGTRGIGRAISTAFLSAGGRVIATYLENEAAAVAFQSSLGEQSGRLSLFPVNVADYQKVEAFYREIDKQDLVPDVLVNNAGIRKDGVLAMMPPGDWSKVIATHLDGTYNMTKFAIKAMIRKRYGRIVTITSPVGKYGFAGQANYAAAKAGQVGLTRALSKEVASRGITVNCVSPGFIGTDLIADLPEKQRQYYIDQVPLKRFGKPEEVASCVLFLASRESEYINGTTLEVTGGL